MTVLLLDTRVVLWWLADSPRLTESARRAVQDADAVHVSAASTWEVAIKTALGKLDVRFDEGSDFPGTCADQGFALTAVTHEDAWAVGALPTSRTDPFDRLIAATARRRGWAVVTADPAFRSLGVDLLEV